MSAAQTQPRFTPRSTEATPLTVVDTTTGLEWLVKPLPRAGHQQQLDAIAALDAAGHTDWRMPNRTELQTLVDLTKYSPCIDTEAFPDIDGGWFWTSDLCAWSSASASSASAWLVSFSYGNVYDYRRDSGGFALAVRRASQ